MHRTEGLVSTIIPVYNRPAMLRKAVTSVLEQTYRPVEIIIVNDGSMDGTSWVADSLRKDNPKEVQVIHQSNLGPGAAREKGLVEARGEFIQFLDSDDRLLPKKFDLQVAGLNAFTNCALSYGKTREYSINEAPVNVPSRRTGEIHTNIFPAALRGRLWATETPLYRRKALDSIGPWSSLCVLEDWEYECRLGGRRAELHYCDEFVSDHLHHEGSREGLRWRESKKAFRDLLAAHLKVLEYAHVADVVEDSAEMRHFARNLFRLARDAGARGLVEDAKQLLKLASGLDRNRRSEYRLYRWSTMLLGWERAAAWGAHLAAGRTRWEHR
ncbi:MAG: glycosyltransferase family A protein [Pseudomonadota bacterium]